MNLLRRDSWMRARLAMPFCFFPLRKIASFSSGRGVGFIVRERKNNCMAAPCQEISTSILAGLNVCPALGISSRPVKKRPSETSDDVLLRYALRLDALGVSRKTIAGVMHRDPSWVTRWLNSTGNDDISGNQERAFAKFARALAAVSADLDLELKKRFNDEAPPGSPPAVGKTTGPKRKVS